jgi:subtilisin family serine protease
MNLNFSSKDVALAKKINFDLIAKHFKALEEGNDVIIDIPPTQIQALTTESSLNNQPSWGWDFLQSQFLDNKLKLGEKFKRKILYCVVDTMAYPTHTALTSDNQFVDKKYCKDFTVDSSQDDGHGHGHHVSGIILGKHPQYKLGVGYVNGVNYGDLIMAQKGLGKNGGGSTESLVNAINHGLNVWKDNFKDYLLVFNFSWGATTENNQITKAINDAVNNGAFVNAAAGNNGTGILSFPGALPNVISWGAHDNRGNKASFSQYGNNLVGIAPGVQIWSCFKDNGSYVSWDGTSMATPHGTAAVGLLLKYNIEIKNQNDLKEYLIKNLTDGGNPGRDDWYGSGYPKFDGLFK